MTREHRQGQAPRQIHALPENITSQIQATLQFPNIRFIPVRHHSPACAIHLESLLAREKPDVILIEAPADTSSLIPLLAAKDAHPPLAIYLYYVDQQANWVAGRVANTEPVRYRCFVPFAEFSPEWVSIRNAKPQAEIRFIDLPYYYRLYAAQGREQDRQEWEASLLDESKLGSQVFAQQVVERAGCRDFNEWWDRYFESAAQHRDAEHYFADLLTWCALLRENQHIHGGVDAETLQREHYMAEKIRPYLAADKTCFVITGGFHTCAVAQRLSQAAQAFDEFDPPGEHGMHLLPYSLQRLSSSNAYAAGIPDCGFYQQVWQQYNAGEPQPYIKAGESWSHTVFNELRSRGELVALPDLIEANTMSRRLAALRSATAGRLEIRDAMISAFCKTTSERGERIIADIIDQSAANDVVGRLPRNTPLAAIVEDFRQHCRAYALPLTSANPKEKRLDIYRKARHRAVSQFLHQLAFLQVPYGEFVAGPDFVHAIDLNRVQEHWQLRWTTEAEARLTEMARYGPQVKEACLNLLRERAAASCDCVATAGLLVRALSMGIHQLSEGLLAKLAVSLATEAEFTALVDCLALLHRADSAYASLEGHKLGDITRLQEAGFERACERLTWLGQMDATKAEDHRAALANLNGFVANQLPWCRDALYEECLLELHDNDTEASLRGTAAAILATRRVWDQTTLQQQLMGAVSTGDLQADYLGAYLLGFLPLARALLIHDADLIQAISGIILQWDEDRFLECLPQLRLAFTVLTKRECEAVANTLLTAFGLNAHASDLTRDIDWTPEDLATLSELRDAVQASLKQWGLAG